MRGTGTGAVHRAPMTWPTEQVREAVEAYLAEHSFDDAQCAACGTVRWRHAAHFLDFLAPLIRAREAEARRAGAAEAIDAADDLEAGMRLRALSEGPA